MKPFDPVAQGVVVVFHDRIDDQQTKRLEVAFGVGTAWSLELGEHQGDLLLAPASASEAFIPFGEEFRVHWLVPAPWFLTLPCVNF